MAKMGPPRKKFDIDKAVLLHSIGVPMRNLCERFGVCSQTMYSRFKEAGYKSIRDKLANLDSKRLAFEYIMMNKTQKELAKEQGVSRRTLCRALRIAGIPAFYKKSLKEENEPTTNK